MDDEGYVVTFSCGGWKITQRAMIIAQGKMKDTLYTTTNIKDCVTIAREKCDADLWHDRRRYTSEGKKKLQFNGELRAELKTVMSQCEDSTFEE